MLNLSPLLPFVARALAAERNDRQFRVLGVPEDAQAAGLAALAAESGGPVVVVVARPDRAAALADELAAWLGDEKAVAAFPEQDTAPSHRVARDARASEQRLETLQALHSDSAPAIVLASGLA